MKSKLYSRDHPRPTLFAQSLRRIQTPAERLLWGALRQRRCGGAKFSRQMPVGPFVVDFLCRERALVVEVDGQTHEFTVEQDARRTRYLEGQGLRVVRFTNEEVLKNLEGVVRQVEIELTRPTPVRCANLPLPQAGVASDAVRTEDATPACGRDRLRSSQGGPSL